MGVRLEAALDRGCRVKKVFCFPALACARRADVFATAGGQGTTAMWLYESS